MIIDIVSKYGLTSADKARTLREAGIGDSVARSRYPHYFRRWTEGEGKTPDSFLNNGTFTSAYLDAFWSGHAHAITANPAASGNIYVSAGEWWHNQILYWPYGRVIGDGNFIDSRFDTQISPWHERWNGDVKNRHSLVSNAYGRDDLLGYHESSSVDNIRFDGRKTSSEYDPSYDSTGLIGWDLGEGSMIGRIKVDNYNGDNIRFVRATPAHALNISSFRSNRSAVALVGAALGTLRIDLLSGDESPILIEMRAGHGREPGGCLSIGNIKCETTTTPENLIGPWKYQIAGVFRGQYNVEIGNIQYSCPNGKVGQLFYEDPKLTNGSPQASRLHVSGKGFGYASIVTNSVTKKYYTVGDYQAFDLVSYSGNGECYINQKLNTGAAYNCSSYLTGAKNGVINFSACTPSAGTVTTPVIPTPVDPPIIPPVVEPVNPTTLIASYDFSGSGTTTITAQVGTAMTQSVAGKRVTSISGGKLNNTNPTATYPTNWVKARRIKITGFKSGAWNYQQLCEGVVCLPNGKMVCNISGSDENITMTPYITNSTVNIDLVLPRSYDIKRFLAIDGAGNALQFTADKIEIFK